MLRHTGGKGRHSRKPTTFARITDRAGWARIGDISRTAANLKGSDRVPPMTINVNYMLGVVMDDDKG
eukprot:15009367-Heterocapsa_arctica.AAC.1